MTTIAMSSHTVRLGDATVGYTTIGSGEPVLFIHGAGIIGGWDFAKGWGADHQIICPYQAGWGTSDDPDPGMGIDNYVQRNLELMDQLGFDRFHLVGFSMGGWIASKLAARHPERVRKLVLVSPAGYWSDIHPTADLFAIDPTEILSYLAADPQVLLQYFPPAADPISSKVELYRNDSAFSLLAWNKLGTEDHLQCLKYIRAKTLLLWGEQDRIVPFSQAPEWQASIPDARIHALEKTGHYPFLEAPDAVAAVHNFLLSEG